MEDITRFRGQYAFLSNFYPVNIQMDGEIYASVEDAFQAAKTLDPHDRECIRVAQSPAHAKKMGRRVNLRPDWESIKIEVMLDLVRKKFQYEDLKELLLTTGDAALVEGNNHGDRFWGCVNGQGRNELGKILMHVREELRRGDTLVYFWS